MYFLGGKRQSYDPSWAHADGTATVHRSLVINASALTKLRLSISQEKTLKQMLCAKIMGTQMPNRKFIFAKSWSPPPKKTLISYVYSSQHLIASTGSR